MAARVNAHRNSGRAIRSLWILIGIMILSLGGLSKTVASPPSPLAGIGFAAGALVFTFALILASRITIALERARRAARRAIEAHNHTDAAPIAEEANTRQRRDLAALAGTKTE